jgi:hypothetical protein
LDLSRIVPRGIEGQRRLVVAVCMNLNSGNQGRLLCWLLATLMAGFAFVAGAQVQPAQARVVNVRGHASYLSGGQWRPLASGMALTNGSAIKTEAETTVDFLLYSSRTTLRLLPNSELHFEKLTKEPGGEVLITETTLNLTAGVLVGSQCKLRIPSQFKIKTAKAVAQIVGTEYAIRADGAVSCLSGSIDVRYNLPNAGGSVLVTVAAGFTFDPATGQVVPTTAAYLQNLIADITTVQENAQTFKAGGATIVVKPGNISPVKGNNGVGNGVDPQPPGNPPINDGPGTSPGSPGNKGGA